MSDRYRSVKGMRDLLPPDTAVWAGVEACAREIFGRYGYEEIRTPLVEDTELFVRSVGESTDIVGKEMYTFEDRKGRSLTLRPESTASTARAFLEHGLAERGLPQRLFYVGPHFRYERPQKGRYRQFHQIGAELIGDPGPASDAELVSMLVRFFEELGLKDLVVLLNTVGDAPSRERFRSQLVAFLEPHRDRLGADSVRRLETNPLRILDTKNPAERQLLANAPQLADALTAEASSHFDGVRSALEQLDIAYRIEPRLVRGLDYYSNTVFEIVSDELGAQDAIVGGGRYDGLIGSLGGPEQPGIGFAIGQDRLIEVLPPETVERYSRPAPVHLVAVGDVSHDELLVLADGLRREGLAVSAELTGRSLRSALKRADKDGARWVLLLGDDELAAGEVTVKDLVSGEQEGVARERVASWIAVRATGVGTDDVGDGGDAEERVT